MKPMSSIPASQRRTRMPPIRALLGLMGFAVCFGAPSGDRNAKGVIDGGDRAIARGGVLTRVAGAALDLVIGGSVPAGAAAAARARVQLTATAAGAIAAATDTIEASAAPAPPALAF